MRHCPLKSSLSPGNVVHLASQDHSPYGARASNTIAGSSVAQPLPAACLDQTVERVRRVGDGGGHLEQAVGAYPGLWDSAGFRGEHVAVALPRRN